VAVLYLYHGAAQPALPSAGADAQVEPPAVAPSTAVNEPADDDVVFWSLPPVRLGGSLAYVHGRNSADGVSSMQSALSTTVNAATRSFIWQPWFAQFSATLGLTKVSSSSAGDLPSSNSASDGVLVTGGGQLSVLSRSNFPFEAHFVRNDNRVNTNLALPSDATSQRYGFVQQYFRDEGIASLAWDRGTQSSASNGGDQQDNLQLNLSYKLESHQLQLNGTHATNLHERTGENASQTSLTVQHNYLPDPDWTVLSMANVSKSDLHLQQGGNSTQLVQLNSNVFWRAPEEPISVNGGVRVMAFGSDQSASAATFAGPAGNRILNGNANAGINYDYSPSIRINAGINVNTLQSSGGITSTSSLISSSEILGASYQPEGIQLGSADYSWGASVNAYNRSNPEDSQRGLALQFSHSLSQSYKLDGGSTISLNFSQGLAAGVISDSGKSVTLLNAAPAPSLQQMTHSGSASWDFSQQSGAAVVRLSVNDSRALDGNQAYFQLFNIQASSSLPTSGYSSWTGNLTLQSIRQGSNVLAPNQPIDGSTSASAGGSLSYQTQRLFGIRNLRLGTELRLNLQSQQSQRALLAQQSQDLQQSYLSQLENRSEQEAAAWAGNVAYAIGRTQLRLNGVIARTNVIKNQLDAVTGASTPVVEEKTNRALQFTLTRYFGAQ
jgi:hypothetical protein